MCFALGRLRLSPQNFWSMTMPELNAILFAMGGKGTRNYLSMSHHHLHELMAQFPDGAKNEYAKK